MVAQKQVIDPSQWLEAAQIINLFLEEEQNKLFKLEQRVAQIQMFNVGEGDNLSVAKTKATLAPEYLLMRQQKAKIERAIALIQITKLQARLANDNFHSN